jgi:hypothetical protein
MNIAANSMSSESLLGYQKLNLLYGIPFWRRACDSIPYTPTIAFLLLHANVKDQPVRLWIPMDGAPVAPAHYIFLLSAGTVRVLDEQWNLAKVA